MGIKDLFLYRTGSWWYDSSLTDSLKASFAPDDGADDSLWYRVNFSTYKNS